MENASKALLIAGGIFFAILILSTMMYMSNSITEIGKSQDEKKAAEQLAAFNAEYEAYNKQLMYGTDIVTIVNKAKEDKITITINDTGTEYNTLNVSNLNSYLDNLKKNIHNSTLADDNTNVNYEGVKIFKCTSIEYSSETGKVTSMSFESKQI